MENNEKMTAIVVIAYNRKAPLLRLLKSLNEACYPEGKDIPLPKKTFKSFGLKMRPKDANIIHDINGSDLFLYDTKTKSLASRCLSGLRDFFCKNTVKDGIQLYRTPVLLSTTNAKIALLFIISRP